MEFAILRGWVGSVIPKRARAALEARVVGSAAELINALQDHLVLEGDRSEGQAAIFKRGAVEGSKDRSVTITWFKCGKVGHKAFDCWTGKGGAGVPKAAAASGGVAHVIICYTCGEEGHKSPHCPKGVKGEKAEPKDVKTKPVMRIWRSQPKCVQLEGVVNGHETLVLLDSGAAISVVPESLVSVGQLTGNEVAVKPFGVREPMLLPTADVSFEIDKLKWVESVAVAPRQEGVECKVLLSLDLQSKRGLELVLVANKVSPREVLRVMTRAQSTEDKKREEEEAMLAEKEVPRAKPCPEDVNSEIEVEVEMIEVCARAGSLDRKEEEFGDESLGIEEEEFAFPEDANREVDGNSEVEAELIEVCARVGDLDRKEEEFGGGVLGIEEEEFEKEYLGIEEETSEDGDEGRFKLMDELRGEVEFEVPPVKAGNHSRVALVKETMSDPSLEKWRNYAEKGEQGFEWREGLLYQRVTTHVMETVYLMVLPKSFRRKVLELAHEKLKHMGARRVRPMVRKRFVWPGMM